MIKVENSEQNLIGFACSRRVLDICDNGIREIHIIADYKIDWMI